MPIYEYQCERCGTVTDIKHGFKETPTSACPKCGSTDLKRVFNAAGIVFKGSGFYVNDSRKASSSESSAKSEAPKSEAPKSDGGGKGEAAA